MASKFFCRHAVEEDVRGAGFTGASGTGQCRAASQNRDRLGLVLILGMDYLGPELDE